MNNKLINTISILAVLFLSACGGDLQKKPTESKKSGPLKTFKLMASKASGDVKLPGVLQPFEQVQIFPRVSGFVKDVRVDRGTVVHKGQILMTLDAPEVNEHVAAGKLQYTRAYATYMASKDKYERMLETSHTPGTISGYDLGAARNNMMGDSAMVQGLLAEYNAQRAMQGYLVISAPFDGIITERNVHTGALVGPGSQGKPMLILQQQSKLRLVVSVPEQYAGLVGQHTEASFCLNALPSVCFKGEVTRSSGSLSDNYRAETVEIDVPNEQDRFKAGMYAEVSLSVKGAPNGFTVPKSAIVTTTERKYIVTVENSHYHLIDVKEGNAMIDAIEVFGELKEGTMVVEQPTYTIKEGEMAE